MSEGDLVSIVAVNVDQRIGVMESGEDLSPDGLHRRGRG